MTTTTSLQHDAYYRAYLPAILALHERLSTKAVLRRYRANAETLKAVCERIDADRAANGGKVTDWTLVDEYDHKEDLSGGLHRILTTRGVEVCTYCLLDGGWHAQGCREELIQRVKQ